MKSSDPTSIAISAIQNASTVPVTSSQVIAALRTGQGEPSHLRAMFGDVAFETLIRIGIKHGISNAEIGRAYLRARRSAAARNPELDEWCAEQFGVPAFEERVKAAG